VFFSAEDAVSWYRCYIFNEKKIFDVIEKQLEENFIKGNYNEMLKIEIFKTLMKEEEEETLYTLLRSLYTYIEPFYNYSREAEMFYYLLTYLKTSGKNKRKKLTLNDLKPYWTEYSTTLKRDLTDYDNIYFENLGPSAINQI